MLKSVLENIQIVLVEPTHPGNIGAVARAMKTMGLVKLVLVKPKIFPDYEATRRAAGAESVLQEAVVVDDLQSAIADCQWVVGTSVRDREITWPTIDPKQAAEQIVEKSVGDRPIAVLFGRERSGLTNAELDMCHAQIRISANDEYNSLNLASAVQIIAYEIRVQALSANEPINEVTKSRERLATPDEQQGYFQHLEDTLQQLDFIKSNPPTKLMRKITRLYNKAQLSVEEVQILRGILTAMQMKLNNDTSDKSSD